MTNNNQKTNKKVKKLQRDISVLTTDIHSLQNILNKVNYLEQEEKDKQAIESIEGQL